MLTQKYSGFLCSITNTEDPPTTTTSQTTTGTDSTTEISTSTTILPDFVETKTVAPGESIVLKSSNPLPSGKSFEWTIEVRNIKTEYSMCKFFNGHKRIVNINF